MYIIYIIILTITLFVLLNNQSKTRIIRPGWFWNVGCFLYYGLPILIVYIFPKLAYETHNRIFDESFIEHITIPLIICQISFLLIELFFRNSCIVSNINTVRSNTYRIHVYIILFISIFLFIQRWKEFGGYFMILAMDRTETINEASQSSNFTRYDIFLNIATAILLYNIFTIKNYLKNNKILIFSYSVFSIAIIMMGTRLLLFNYIIAFFCCLYMFNKKYIDNNKKRILIYTIFLTLSFISYQNIRTNINAFFKYGNTLSIERHKISFIPEEIFTGILSEYSIHKGIANRDKENTYFLRLIPNKIKKTINLKTYNTYSKDIAELSKYSSGRPVYTIPFVFDIYHGSGESYFLTFIYSIIVCSIIYIIINKISRHNNILYLIVFYCLLYNLVRVEGPIWFSKLYLSVILMYLTLLFAKKTKSKLSKIECLQL